ncbi:MAG TPA: hypothetical protein VM287_06310 [Egibacteraceae bacterium]|nr:hypothetical protein [Egibacteraceae bacterium]
MTAKQRLLVIVLGMAGMVLAASAAFACANLVTINVSEHSGTPGSTVAFRVDATRDDPAPDAQQPRAVSDVVVRWNGHNGQELARGRSVNRTLSGSFTIPDVPPGQYMVLANQTYTDTGDPVPGAPARTTIEVTAAQAAGAAVSSQSTDTSPAAPAAPAEESSVASQPAAPAAPAAQTAPQQSAATPPAAHQPAASAQTQGAPASPQASAVSPSESGVVAPASAPTGAVAAPQQPSPAVTSPTGVEQAARARFAAAERAAAAAGLHEVAAQSTAHPAADRAPAQAAATAPSPQTTWWSALPASAAAGWVILALGLAMAAALSNRRRHGLGLAVGRLPL